MIFETKEYTVKDNLKITLKTPDAAEAMDVLNFIQRSAGQTPFLLSSPEDFNIPVEKEEAFLKSQREGNDYFIAVYDNGEIVGDCGLNFMRHVKDRHRCSVGITIDEKYWGKGIGSLLFDVMIELAKNTPEIEQIELGVISVNERAKRLYKSKGFEKTGVIKNALKLSDGTYLDEEMMVKFL